VADWVEISEQFLTRDEEDAWCLWGAYWYEELDETIREWSPRFAEVEDAVTWARQRCDRVFVEGGSGVLWAGSGAAPIHPILGEPIASFASEPSSSPTVESNDDVLRVWREQQRLLKRPDAEMLIDLRTQRGLSLGELARLTHVDERWLEGAELGILSGDERDQWEPWERVASVFVRGVEFDPNEQRKRRGWVARRGHFLADAMSATWKRHRMTRHP
jgi:hypothetical protein